MISPLSALAPKSIDRRLVCIRDEGSSVYRPMCLFGKKNAMDYVNRINLTMHPEFKLEETQHKIFIVRPKNYHFIDVTRPHIEPIDIDSFSLKKAISVLEHFDTKNISKANFIIKRKCTLCSDRNITLTKAIEDNKIIYIGDGFEPKILKHLKEAYPDNSVKHYMRNGSSVYEIFKPLIHVDNDIINMKINFSNEDDIDGQWNLVVSKAVALSDLMRVKRIAHYLMKRFRSCEPIDLEVINNTIKLVKNNNNLEFVKLMFLSPKPRVNTLSSGRSLMFDETDFSEEKTYSVVNLKLNVQKPSDNMKKPLQVRKNEAYQALVDHKEYPLLINVEKTFKGVKLMRSKMEHMFIFDNVFDISEAYELFIYFFKKFNNEDLFKLEFEHENKIGLFVLKLKKDANWFDSDFNLNHYGRYC